MPLSRRAWLAAGAVLAALGAASVLYVLLAPASKPPAQAYLRFAHGSLAALHVRADAPPQPEQVFFDAAGAPHRLRDYRGRLVLLNLWGTVCVPCVEELPTLGALRRRYAGRLEVLAVSYDSGADTARAKAELQQLTGGALPFLQEPTRRILFAAQAETLPTTILYDRQGREVLRVSSKADWSGPEASAMIDAFLAQEGR